MDDPDPESVLQRLRLKFIEAFQFNHKDLADLMHSKGFLPDDDHQTVTAVGTEPNKSDRARIMMNSLVSKVKINPKKYQEFLELVRPRRRNFEDVVYLLERGE